MKKKLLDWSAHAIWGILITLYGGAILVLCLVLVLKVSFLLGHPLYE